MSASWAIPEIVSDARILVDPDDPGKLLKLSVRCCRMSLAGKS